MRKQKIGASWYKFSHPKGFFCVRRHDRNSWGYYVRDLNNATPPRWENGREMYTGSYQAAVAAAKLEADRL